MILLQQFGINHSYGTFRKNITIYFTYSRDIVIHLEKIMYFYI